MKIFRIRNFNEVVKVRNTTREHNIVKEKHWNEKRKNRERIDNGRKGQASPAENVLFNSGERISNCFWGATLPRRRRLKDGRRADLHNIWRISLIFTLILAGTPLKLELEKNWKDARLARSCIERGKYIAIGTWIIEFWRKDPLLYSCLHVYLYLKKNCSLKIKKIEIISKETKIYPHRYIETFCLPNYGSWFKLLGVSPVIDGSASFIYILTKILRNVVKNE